MDPPPLRSASMAQPKAEVAEVAGILDLGHFSIAVQLIYRPMMTEHHNKQFITHNTAAQRR